MFYVTKHHSGVLQKLTHRKKKVIVTWQMIEVGNSNIYNTAREKGSIFSFRRQLV